MADRNPFPGDSVLVPVGASATLRTTVGHAVETAIENGCDGIHFVAPVEWHEFGDVDADAREGTRALLNRIDVWVEEDDPDGVLSARTAMIGTDEYLFSPADYAEIIAGYADERGIKRIIVDPEYSPGGNVPLLKSLESSLGRRGFEVTTAPSGTPVRRGRLTGSSGAAQFGVLFGISFLFYQLLGGFVIVTGDTFDLYYELLTGTFVSGLVAGTLYSVTLSGRADPRVLLVRLGRFGLFVPYLLYEIIKSNVLITFIILHPKLPIDPRMTKVRTAVWGGPALTTLANSITLTPGTLSVRTDGQYLYVHGLFGGARDGIADGALERAVRFVFYGRQAAAIPGPEERGDYELLETDADPTDDSEGSS